MPANDAPNEDDCEQVSREVTAAKDNSAERLNDGSRKSSENDPPAGDETAVFGTSDVAGTQIIASEDGSEMRQINDIRQAAGSPAHGGTDGQVTAELLATGVLRPTSL